MINIFVAILVFILVYVVSNFLLAKVKPIAGIAEVLSIILGIFAALVWVHAI